MDQQSAVGSHYDGMSCFTAVKNNTSYTSSIGVMHVPLVICSYCADTFSSDWHSLAVSRIGVHASRRSRHVINTSTGLRPVTMKLECKRLLNNAGNEQGKLIPRHRQTNAMQLLMTIRLIYAYRQRL